MIDAQRVFEAIKSKGYDDVTVLEVQEALNTAVDVQGIVAKHRQRFSMQVWDKQSPIKGVPAEKVLQRPDLQNAQEILLVYLDGNLMHIQPNDPDTGQLFATAQDALAWGNKHADEKAQQLAFEEVVKATVQAIYGVGDQTNQTANTIVKVQFIDPATGNPINYAQIDATTGEATVAVSVTVTDSAGNILTTVSKTYIVPYRSAIDRRQKGSVIVDVANGQGQKNLTFSKFQTGVYKVVSQDILDASTMQSIKGVKFDPPEVKLAIVE